MYRDLLEAFLILDGNIRTSCVLVLVTDKVRDLLILCLLHGGLVTLVALAEDILLYPVHTWKTMTVSK